jgi:hypothetical protein
VIHENDTLLDVCFHTELDDARRVISHCGATRAGAVAMRASCAVRAAAEAVAFGWRRSWQSV